MSKIFAYKPSAYKEGKAYLVIPSGADKFYSFSRPSTANRIDPDRDIATMAINVPRIDYSDEGCPVLLLEGETTNTVENSRPSSTEYIDNNISYDVVDIPFFGGITNVVSYEDNLLDRRRYFGTSVNGINYTISCYVIMNDFGEPFIGSGSSNDFELWIGKEANITSFKEKQAGDNNIWRVWGYGEGVSDSVTNGVRKRDTNSDRGFIMTQLDIIEGNTPSSPIYTNGSTVTREAEICGNYTQTYDPNSLVWKLNTKAISNDGTIRNCSISDASGNSYQVRYTTTDDVVSVLVESSSSVQETINIPLDVIGYYSDIWVVADNGTLKVKTNGILRSVNTNITAPLSLTRKDYHDGLGGNSFSGRIKGDIVDDDVTSFNSTATSINEILNNSKLTIR